MSKLIKLMSNWQKRRYDDQKQIHDGRKRWFGGQKWISLQRLKNKSYFLPENFCILDLL